MKKRKRAFVIIALVLLGWLVGRTAYRNHFIGPCSYSFYFRVLDIQQLERGMTYGEIKEIWGEPNGMVERSTGLWPYYELPFGRYVTLHLDRSSQINSDDCILIFWVSNQAGHMVYGAPGWLEEIEAE